MNRRTLLKSSMLYFTGLMLAQQGSTALALTPSKESDASDLLQLNFNENALGMSPKATQAVIDNLSKGARYPDAEYEGLLEKVSAYHGLGSDSVLLSNGSSEAIRCVVQATLHNIQAQGKKAQLVVPDPTFNYAELYAEPLAVPVIKVPLREDMSFDLATMRKSVEQFEGISVVYLCNPNNPTGMITPSAEIEQWVKSAAKETLFLIDEAYAEFVTDPRFTSAIQLVKTGYTNVVVTRTFSKVYAMAGLRVGYAVMHPEREQQIAPWIALDNMSLTGAVAAISSLEDKAFLQKSLQSTERARAIVTKALEELDLAYLPSQANFIFHRVPGSVKEYQQRMKQHNILVGREFPPAVGWSRLTLGTPLQMERFVQVLRQFRQQGWV